MRIQESDVRLTGWHEEDNVHEVETHGQCSFRNIFQSLAASDAGGHETEREQVVRLLQSLVDAMLAALDGKKCRSPLAADQDLPDKLDAQPANGQVEWHWETTEKIREHERTRVEGSGRVRTADGKSIAFDVGLDMCRDYSCERKTVNAGSAVLHDPLALNFEGKAAELTGQRFSFDLDANGQVEWIPGLGQGSSFLALDRNGNGRVDNGSELFGTGTGDGFGDLAKLDADGNGWLDESDPAFAELRLWQGGPDGQLTTLADAGIGALWLGSTDSPFAIKDSANQILGEIRASGIYLREDGRVGSLQQVDLATETENPKTATA